MKALTLLFVVMASGCIDVDTLSERYDGSPAARDQGPSSDLADLSATHIEDMATGGHHDLSSDAEPDLSASADLLIPPTQPPDMNPCRVIDTLTLMTNVDGGGTTELKLSTSTPVVVAALGAANMGPRQYAIAAVGGQSPYYGYTALLSVPFNTTAPSTLQAATPLTSNALSARVSKGNGTGTKTFFAFAVSAGGAGVSPTMLELFQYTSPTPASPLGQQAVTSSPFSNCGDTVSSYDVTGASNAALVGTIGPGTGCAQSFVAFGASVTGDGGTTYNAGGTETRLTRSLGSTADIVDIVWSVIESNSNVFAESSPGTYTTVDSIATPSHDFGTTTTVSLHGLRGLAADTDDGDFVVAGGVLNALDMGSGQNTVSLEVDAVGQDGFTSIAPPVTLYTAALMSGTPIPPTPPLGVAYSKTQLMVVYSTANGAEAIVFDRETRNVVVRFPLPSDATLPQVASNPNVASSSRFVITYLDGASHGRVVTLSCE